ncbi:MAG: hypothetical protein M1514_00890, partial [Patescibacteria group bacterium]|nr:hypothetical protein [Patescibacteria group bacterium]
LFRSSAEERQEGIFFGNVFGSVVVNSSFILGLVALISPIQIQESKHFFSTGIFTLLVFAFLPLSLKLKKKLDRNEGVVLLLIYLTFILTGLVLTKI